MRYLLLVGLLGLNACATITKGTEQTITVVTNPAGAHCTLSNEAGMWEIASTPGEAVVKRHFSPLAIHCAAEGLQGGSASLEPHTRGRAYGNILLGGAPAIIDANTGAGYEYKPGSVALELRP